MRRLACASIVVLGSLLFAPAGQARDITEVECQADSLRQINTAGNLAITEYAFSYSASNCPTRRIVSAKPIFLQRGATLYIWARLQGDSQYLASGQGAQEIIAYFDIKIGDNWSYQTAISAPGIVVAKARQEAAVNNGAFDWRIKLERWSLESAAEYRIRFEQNGAPICLLSTPGSDCAIHFALE